MHFIPAQQATAQSASFRSVDTNRDGVLSFEELVAQFGVEGAQRLFQQSDSNNDNILTILELRQIRDDNADRDHNRTLQEEGDQSVGNNGDDDLGDGGDD